MQQVSNKKELSHKIIPYNLKYKPTLFLSSQSYSGVIEIHFELKDVCDIYLNFSESNLHAVIVNQKQIQSKFQNSMIFIPKQWCIMEQSNVIIISYTKNYDTNGKGLTYVTDSNSSSYVFTHFQPQGCRNVIPCFDIPHVKATFQLLLITPTSWIARGNQPIKYTDSFDHQKLIEKTQLESQTYNLIKKIQHQKNGIFWAFEKTQILPTYLFAFAAGQFVQIKSNIQNDNIPISIFAPKTLQVHLHHHSNLIFRVISNSIRFYSQLLKVPYPFSKSDHIFLYQLNIGAMENPGLITYECGWIQDTQMTPISIMMLCTIICHELAHQWFGNLVTMQQWKDIWLNEGFAQFLSYKCMNHIKDKVDLGFSANFDFTLLDKKQSSCRHDRSNYSHPILTDKFQNPSDLFDKITYIKGAYVIRQLQSIIEQNTFWKGINEYLNIYSWRNAAINELFEVLQKYCSEKEVDLTKWKNQWILADTYNTLQIKRLNNKCTLTQIPIFGKQSSRYYKISVALFTSDCKYQIKQLPLISEYQTQLVISPSEFSGILVDPRDKSFIQRKLNSQSRQFFISKLKSIEDSLIQFIIWKYIFEQVTNGEMTCFEYMFILFDNLTTDNESLFQYVLEDAWKLITKFTPANFRGDLKNGMFTYLQEMMKAKEHNSFVKAVVKKFYFLFCNTPGGRTQIKRWYQGQNIYPDYILSISDKWKALRILSYNRLIENQQLDKQITKLLKQEYNYTYALHAKQLRGLNYTNEQAQALFESLMIKNQHNLKQNASKIRVFLNTNYYLVNYNQNKRNIIIKGLEEMSEENWLNVFNSLIGFSTNPEDDLFFCLELLEISKSQHLQIKIEQKIISLQQMVKSYQLYNLSELLENS